MDGKLQIIAGILSLFFLGVAIAKSMAQRARRREAAAKSIASSRSGAIVSLHNPFAEQQQETAPAVEQKETAPEPPPAPPQAPAAPVESIYKWV